MKQNEVIELYKEVKDKILLNKDQYNRIYEMDLEIMLGKLFHVQKWRRHLVIEELMMLGYISVECIKNQHRMFVVHQ